MSSDFSELAPIETSRLHIRTPRIEDRASLFFMRTDPEINKFVQRKVPKTLEDIDVFIQTLLQDRKLGKTIYWVIALKENPNQYIGAISLWHFSDDKKTGEVGYELHPDYHKKGYMNEALQSVLNFGFEHLYLQRILAHTHINNLASRKLLEKNGFLLTHKKDQNCTTNIIYEFRK